MNKVCIISKVVAMLVLGIFCFPVYAQDLLDQMIEVRKLVHQDKYDEAYNTLLTLEKKCINSDRDSVKVLFYESMGLIKFAGKQYADAIKYYEPVPSLYERLNIKNQDYIESFLALGMSHQRLGNDSIAEEYYRTGLLRTVNAKNANNYRPSFYFNLGQLYKEKGDSMLAAECFKHINSAQYGTLMDGKAEGLVDDGELQALTMRKNGEYEQSLLVYDKLIERVSGTIGTTNEVYARLLYSKALVLSFNLGRDKEAKPLFRELYDMRNDLSGFNENVLSGTARYLQIIAKEGDFSDVDTIFPEALSYAAKSSNETDICLLYRFVGNGYYWANNYIQAIPYYEKYNAMGRKEDGLSFLEIPNMLAVCYILTDQQDNAKDILFGLMERYKDEIEDNPSMKSLIYHNYGRALMLSGQYKDATVYLSIANQTYKEITGEDNPKTLIYLEECKGYF